MLAGAGSDPQTPRQAIKVQVNLVNLFVTARDKRTKKIVLDLGQNEFKVVEDGKPQAISFFSHESNLPITLGLLIDTSGTEQDAITKEQDAAVRFLSRLMRHDDRGIVISFDTEADLLAELSGNPSALERAIRRTRIRLPGSGGLIGFPTPSTVFYDAVYLACQEEMANQSGRPALVILTDAHDQGSKMRLRDAIEAAQRANTVVYVLLIFDPRYGNFEDIARKLTDDTGGRTIVVDERRRLEDAFDEINQELRKQYAMGYYPTHERHDDGFRKVEVKTTRKGVEILTRRGYYPRQRQGQQSEIRRVPSQMTAAP